MNDQMELILTKKLNELYAITIPLLVEYKKTYGASKPILGIYPVESDEYKQQKLYVKIYQLNKMIDEVKREIKEVNEEPKWSILK